MDKIYKKQYRKNGDIHNCIGRPIGIIDRNGKYICVGDKIKYYDEDCRVLWNDGVGEYEAMICRSKWYGEDEYDSDSYGKSYPLHMDNGGRMEMEVI